MRIFVSDWFNYYQRDDLKDVCFIDWQVTRFASPVIDWHHCIFGCTSATFRRANYQQLMQHYHSTLSTHIRGLGSDPEALFTFDDFQDQLKKFGKYAFVLAPVVVQHNFTVADNIPEFDEMIKKMSTEEFDLVKKAFDDKTQKEYIQGENDLLEDLVQLGYWN